ncbi:chromate efflux transporter [Aliishimia ponticola]|uniref:Chromate efflux transporter n=1 Tax=Aliishimia ponticola TaxID=2499833 RepID=A0A4S4NAH6_9RHOB|nr:chromate efflux transporter [Aliishimia ponticola]
MRETLPVWARIGVLSFGGPAAQIALMHREIVEERGWLTERQFLNATGFCMLLPGPEAMQIATYAGWRLHGTRGGLAAGTLFILPGAAVIMALAAAYVAFGTLPWVQALFLGVQAAVIAIVLQALAALMGRALKGPAHWALAAFGFVALYAFALPFPLVIAVAAAFGALMAPQSGPAAPAPPVSPGLLRTISIWLALWAAPLLALWLTAPEGLLLQIGLFFSKLAVVTFGGAYAVLAYMAQEVVSDYGWLTAGQMMDGLGLAETTPGPLILVTQFVGYLSGYGAGAAAGGGGAGTAMAIAAACLTLWVTFVPCFLWIFAAAPYVEWLTAQPRLSGALQGITAAVVGVIANLSLWFALHVLFGVVTRQSIGPLHLWLPELASLDPGALALAGLSIVALFRLNWPLTRVLGIAATLALGLHLIGVQ